ncbi:MAG: hypothetical protein PHY71_07845, partial [Bacteroidaceae bacterium]|nr:hypothetical protein [Bacteroidaceae bacterium]
TRGFILVQQVALAMLKDYMQSMDIHEQQCVEQIRVEIKENLSIANGFMARLARRHPVNFNKALTYKAVRMLLNHERVVVMRLAQEGMITFSEAEAIVDELHYRKYKV